MIDKEFDGISWATTRNDRAGRAGFNVVFPTLYITILMVMAVGKCFWLAVLSFQSGHGSLLRLGTTATVGACEINL